MGKSLRSKRLKVRKDHFCVGCYAKIEKGETVFMNVWVDDVGGEITTQYWCDVCDEIWNRDYQYGDEFTPGTLNECREQWHTVKGELEMKKHGLEPRRLQSLPRSAGKEDPSAVIHPSTGG